MKLFNKIKKTSLLVAVAALIFTSCNKLTVEPTANVQATQATSPTLASLLDDPSYSIMKAAVIKAGLLPMLSVPTLRFTMYVPDDVAMTASGISAGAIAALPAATVTAIVSYHISPQVITTASISTGFPNFEYPSVFNPAPTVSALFRLSNFPSVRPGVGAWLNNIPLIATNIMAVNGVMHKVYRVVAPPSQYLWDKINSDPELTFFKAAVQRADSGVATGGRIQDLLLNIGGNVTVLAPTDAAMQTFLTGAIAKALIAQGVPPATALGQASFLVATYGTLLLTNPAAISGALAAALSPTTAKGVVVYHILSSQKGTYAPPGIRVFSNNIPSTATQVKTLLNSGGVPFSAHPGVTMQATFTGPAVTAATVKGAANATASNILINPTLTSDLHYLNGVIQKIDQVLLPQ